MGRGTGAKALPSSTPAYILMTHRSGQLLYRLGCPHRRQQQPQQSGELTGAGSAATARSNTRFNTGLACRPSATKAFGYAHPAKPQSSPALYCRCGRRLRQRAASSRSRVRSRTTSSRRTPHTAPSRARCSRDPTSSGSFHAFTTPGSRRYVGRKAHVIPESPQRPNIVMEGTSDAECAAPI